MSMPDFAEANAFVAVLESRSFTKAARLIGLSPPRVSEQVRNLEQRLGVRLIERTTRSVSATLAGEHLYQRLRPVLDDYKLALESTNVFRDRPAGPLRLTMGLPAADAIIEPLLSSFLDRYPDISLEIAVENELVDIVASRYDAGIRAGERLERDMIALRISDPIKVVVAAAPSYIAEHGEPSSPAELASHNCFRVRLPDGSLFPWRFQIKDRVVEVQVSGRLVANTASLEVRAAVDGIGLIQVTPEMVAAELAAGKLVTVLDRYAPPPIDSFFLYYPSRRQMRPALKALVDFLREHTRSRT